MNKVYKYKDKPHMADKVHKIDKPHATKACFSMQAYSITTATVMSSLKKTHYYPLPLRGAGKHI